MRIDTRIGSLLAKIIKNNYLPLIVLTISMALGAGYIYHTWNHYWQQSSVRALDLTGAVAAFVSPNYIQEIIADPDNIQKPEYNYMKNHLISLRKDNPEINFAYFYTVDIDQVYILADSEPADSPYSVLGQAYLDIPEVFKETYASGQPRLTEPIDDSRGTWISALVPIKDPSTNQVAAVFAVDYPIEKWTKEAGKHAFHSAIFVICLLLIIMTMLLIWSKNRSFAEMADKLKNSETLFRTIFEQSPYGIAIGRSNNLVYNSNAMFEKILGRTKAEVASLNWMDLTHPDDLKAEMESFSDLQSGVINEYSFSKRIVRSDGSLIWVNIKVTGLYLSGEQNPGNFICMMEDITERVKAEKALQESERSKSVLLSHLPGLAYRCSLDREWTMHFLSAGCYELTGYQAECLLDNRDLSYNQLIAPEYRELLWNEWQRVISLKSYFKYEYEIITAGGQRKWVLEQGQGVYAENGSVEALEGIIIDITELKQREANILFMKNHDFITGLYNRNYFEVELARLNAQKECLPLSIFIANINGIRLINNAFGRKKGDMVIKAAANILKSCCREDDLLARTGGDEFCILMPNTDINEAYDVFLDIIKAIDDYNKIESHNNMFIISLTVGFSTKTSAYDSVFETIKDAENYMLNRKLLNRRSSHSSILSSIVALLYARSQETEEHGQRIADLAVMVGKKLGLPQQKLDELRLFSMLHDIGKVGIDDRILNKSGSLTDQEWSIMKKHTEIGYNIAMASPELANIAEYILFHHEWWDGRGYPRGLQGDEIPLPSRILAVVDAYDAMTEERVYKKTLTREEAKEEIRLYAGTQFDPNIAAIFLEIV